MPRPILEIKIEEVRVENPFSKFNRKDSLNVREFKNYYHTLNRRKPTNFDEKTRPTRPPISPCVLDPMVTLREFIFRERRMDFEYLK